MTDIPTIVDAVKSILIAAGVGQSSPSQDWFVTVGGTIDSPANLIAIRKTGGKSANPRWSVDYPSIQVRVRGVTNGYRAAEQKVIAVKNALLGIPSQDVAGGRLTAVNAIGDYQDIGQDQNNRPQFTMNFAIIYEPINAGYRE